MFAGDIICLQIKTPSLCHSFNAISGSVAFPCNERQRKKQLHFFCQQPPAVGGIAMMNAPEDLHKFQGFNRNWRQNERFPRQLSLPRSRGSLESRVCEPILASAPCLYWLRRVFAGSVTARALPLVSSARSHEAGQPQMNVNVLLSFFENTQQIFDFIFHCLVSFDSYYSPAFCTT